VKRALFICTWNRLRSPTVEHVFSTRADAETDSAGLGNLADVPLSPEQPDLVRLLESKAGPFLR
jgi:predicted protein tyrosine phosphatase